ncbi:NAD(P)H-hydrate dehydratase [Geminicoccus roseus]|uniref:NAD(P)H-hydrate dehydratase n=1 Tax=Geminicoccus roseus TaxID=404900 RepID=UPI000483B8A9|nr:NAD(P)H-hydrate dehydratase [Geminicoccus roseus]
MLLAPSDVARLDQRAIALGTPGHVLMERAGLAVARAITARFARRPVLVACGPGNNGGDGWVVARLLRAAGWPVTLLSLVDPARLGGDAARAAAAWDGAWQQLQDARPSPGELVVDALFGAGLARDVDGEAALLIRRIAEAGCPVVAVDIPSGIDGATGLVRGQAVRADLTVTFVRKKPGLVLLPGRSHAGTVQVADIGIGSDQLAELEGTVRINQPSWWRDALPRRDALSHKYRFGHAVMIGGRADATGAARLSAMTALRIGAGVVTVAADPDAVPFYAQESADLITRPVAEEADLDRLLEDPRRNAVAIGPAAGVGERTRGRIGRILAAGKRAVLDADALTSIAPCEGRLADGTDLVLTPHEGEFQRLFPDLKGARIERACAAAARSGAVVVLKGGDTIVAAPDGRVAILELDAPALATAGAGDVLTGAILGLLAQNMPAFLAAAAAVRLHAEAGAALGTGLISADLPKAIAARLALH